MFVTVFDRWKHGNCASYRVGNLYTHWSRGLLIANGYSDLMWNIYVDQDIPFKLQAEIWRNTLKSIWICSNIVDKHVLQMRTNFLSCGTSPDTLDMIPILIHSLIIPHYRKVVYPHIETIKIWLLEHVSNIRTYDIHKPYTYHEHNEFIPLVINEEVIVRLEFIKNAK